MTLRVIRVWTETGLEYTFAFLVELEEVESLDDHSLADQGIFLEYADHPVDVPVENFPA